MGVESDNLSRILMEQFLQRRGPDGFGVLEIPLHHIVNEKLTHSTDLRLVLVDICSSFFGISINLYLLLDGCGVEYS